MGKGSTARRRRHLLSGVAALALMAGFSLTAQRAHAQSVTFVVNTTADTNNSPLNSTSCHDASGKCSLRAASQAADNQPAGSTVYITVPAGTYTLTHGALLF